METSKKLEWNVFVARRKLNIPVWLKRHNINSYEELVKKCNNSNIEPPPKDTIDFSFVSENNIEYSILPVGEPISQPEEFNKPIKKKRKI